MAASDNLGRQWTDVQHYYHGYIPQKYGGYDESESHLAPKVHHFEAHSGGKMVGFLQLFGSGEVANIEVNHERQGIGTGLVKFAREMGHTPQRSDAETREGKRFFSAMAKRGLVE